MPAMLRVPTLAISPSEKPFQGKGKPDKILRNGTPGRSLTAQLLTPGVGGHQTKVITKAFSREQKRNVGTSAALGAGITAAINPGTTKRAAAYGISAGRLGVAGMREKDPAGKAQYLKDAKRMGAFAGRNAKAVGKPALAWGAASAGVAAGSAALHNRKMRRLQPVAKSRAMSDAELKRRRNLQSKVAITSSTLGLGSLGALGAGAALKKPRLGKIAATGSIAAGGVSGAGGYNYAAITRAEARKRPVAKAFDAERNRDRRARTETKAAATVGAAGLGGAGYAAFQGARASRQAKPFQRIANQEVQDGWVDPSTGTRSARRVKNSIGDFSMPFTRKPTGREAYNSPHGRKAAGLRKVARKNFKVAGGLAALGVGGVVGADRIASYRQSAGKTYAPRHRRPE